ncbi:unnamed protein product [Porites evermanni]|uniref:Uncharacterized protein n=1 Tax=Porites evermanni TaxID=104178 RepID=A0ABN8MBJ4_9CNID|nr:unnamed protein product [Porites evermanni]
MDKKNLIARALITAITTCYVKRFQLKQPGLLSLKFEDKTFNMEALYWRRKTVAEDAARLLAEANPTKIETPGEESHATELLKRKFVDSPDDNKFNKRMAYETRAKEIVQDVFNRIGCYENFVRRADWADETTTASGDLGTTLVDDTYEEDERKQDDKHLPTLKVTCDGTNQGDGRVSTSKVTSDDDGQDERHVSVPEVTSVIAKEDDGQMSASWVTGTDVDDLDPQLTPDPAKQNCIQQPSLGITCTDNGDVVSATASTARLITISTGEATSRDIEDESMKRLSQKSGRKRWAELKKRRRSYLVGNKMSIGNVVGKGFISKQSTEGTNYNCSEEARLIMDEEKLVSLKEFIALGDTKTTGGDDVVVLNPSKIPSKREFAGKKEYNEVMDSLLWHAQKFTDERVESGSFVLTVHAGKQRRSRLRSRKWAMEFYKFLKQRYRDRLTRCVLLKPSLKLRALVVLSRPFLS